MALLWPQQQHLAVNRLALPTWRAQAGQGRRLLAAKAPFVFTPTIGKITHQQLQMRQIHMQLTLLWLQRNGPLQRLPGGVDLAEFLLRATQAGPAIGELGVAVSHISRQLGGLDMLTHGVQRIAQH